jgi:beta-lactamase regulating signal transducer with metallopeptidase domain
MNPSGSFWLDFFGRLFIESSVLVALAAVVSRKLLPQQRRKVWQVVMSTLLLLFVVEGTGWHRRVHFSTARLKEEAPTSRRLSVEVMPGPGTAAPAAAKQKDETKSPLAGWLPGLIWVGIAACFLTRSFGSRLLFVILRQRRRALNDGDLQQKVDALACQMSVRGRIHLSESTLLAGPIAFGFLRRCICVPESFARAFPEREQQVMLAHEVAHLAVRDPFWYAVADLAAAVFWFNPLAWFGRRQFQSACESAADEASLLVRDGPSTLAECLVQLGKRLAGVKSYGWIGIEGTRFRSALGRRVNRLIGLDQKPWRALPGWWAGTAYCAGVASIAGLLVCSAVAGGSSRRSLVDHVRLLTAVAVVQPAPTSVVDGTLHTRFFRVEPAGFEQTLKEFVAEHGTVAGDTFVEQLRFFLESAGVDLTPPAQVFYNPRLGTLMVRARVQDLDEVEKLVQVLNPAPPQLTIEAKFIEFSDPLDTLDLRNLVIGGFESGTNSFRGILPPSRYRDLVKRLEAQKGVDLLTAPRVTTLSGRQAQIKVVDVRYIATDLDRSDGLPQPRTIAEPFELGPVLDVVPTLRADGVSIELKLISTIREFIGYDFEQRHHDSGPPRPLTPAPIREYLGQTNASVSNPVGGSIESMTPLPTFRVRQAEATTRVWDGQTVVLAMQVQVPSVKNPNLRFERSAKSCLLLVTPVLIDPAGNRVHEEANLPFAEQTVPD